MIKKLTPALFALGLGLLLSACSGSSAASSSAGTSAAEPAVTEAGTAAETASQKTEGAAETTQPASEAAQQETASAAAAETSAASAEEPVTFRVGGLKGPTSMGMVKLLQDTENGSSALSLDFTLAGSADELTPKFIQGDLDLIAVPANLASVLYNKTAGADELLAVNTLGVLYIVSTGDDVSSVADLRGKTLLTTGKGSTPEYVLRYILKENGLDPDKDVTLSWQSEHTETVSALSAGGGIAMLPQPFVTVAEGSVEGLHTVLDLTEEWNKLDNGSALITGVLIARREFAEKYPEQLSEFMKEYKASTAYAVNSPKETAALIEQYGILKAAVAEKALPFCNIVCIEGTEMKKSMQGYLQVLYDQNPASVGGKLPGDDFYYGE